MASGRPDFWRGVMPVQPVLGANQVVWYAVDHDTLDGAPAVDLINYTVPDDYKLYITSGIISCSMAGREYFTLKIDDVEIFAAYYDSLFQLSTNSLGCFVLDAGEKLTIMVSNNDPAANIFWVTLTGFLEHLIA